MYGNLISFCFTSSTTEKKYISKLYYKAFYILKLFISHIPLKFSSLKLISYLLCFVLFYTEHIRVWLLKKEVELNEG